MNEKMDFGKGLKAPEAIFTNEVWVNMLVTDPESTFDTQVYNVTFEPGGRTHWHSHPGGQILLVTEGVGYYQEKNMPIQILYPGDTVTIPPNVNHWHGAGIQTRFVHISMTTQVHLGPADWFGPVSDEDYTTAINSIPKK
ncbi:MAG: cupin domain-containing protein [Candidatus Delongbacteria bacterium]|nr:cupin domain-containing protein [Candidatus Delongbacteria bacterium]MBN2834473.1 cupin domain-containing protein [Candidatus Delongbacteria bacterium]